MGFEFPPLLLLLLLLALPPFEPPLLGMMLGRVAVELGSRVIGAWVGGMEREMRDIGC